jgi:NADPH:quinone reductase-like Zn-dependent oxidoreductase
MGTLKEKLSSYLLVVSFLGPYFGEPDVDLGTVGGTGIFACQLAKNIFKVGKVITTVSTSKVPQVNQLLGEGIVDESESALLR